MKEQYIIPTNFMETGYVLNGAVSVRNAIEAVILALFGFGICKLLPLPDGIESISYYIFIVAPFAMFGLYGIQGDPISVFVLDFIKWRRRRNPCFYNMHGQAYTQEAAEMLEDAPQFRDMLADMVDSVRRKMATEDMDYVEGETFRFAEDPEQAALKQAQEDIAAKKEEAAREEEEKRKLAEEEAKKPIISAQAGSVNAQKIAEMIKLDDLDFGEEGE